MKKSYLVIANYSATASDLVEADSPEEAIEKANVDVGLCYECGGELNLGEIESIQVVADGGRGEVVYTEE